MVRPFLSALTNISEFGMKAGNELLVKLRDRGEFQMVAALRRYRQFGGLNNVFDVLNVPSMRGW
jgi:hypothetical protein